MNVFTEIPSFLSQFMSEFHFTEMELKLVLFHWNRTNFENRSLFGKFHKNYIYFFKPSLIWSHKLVSRSLTFGSYITSLFLFRLPVQDFGHTKTFSLNFLHLAVFFRFCFVLLKGRHNWHYLFHRPSVIWGHEVTTNHNSFRRVLPIVWLTWIAFFIPHCSLKDGFHHRFFKSIFVFVILSTPMQEWFCRLYIKYTNAGDFL